MIKAVKDKEETAKKENMYNIICPEERLVLIRIIRVRGRIIWLNPSIKGSKIDKPIGLP